MHSHPYSAKSVVNPRLSDPMGTPVSDEPVRCGMERRARETVSPKYSGRWARLKPRARYDGSARYTGDASCR